MMMSEICAYLNNYFDRDMPKYSGTFTISGGVLSYDGGDIAYIPSQYYRIIGSALNDAVWQYTGEPDTELMDETFDGTVWLMGVPKAVIAIAAEVEAWQAKYGDVSSAAMSPYLSESFGGYSYQKSAGVASASNSDPSQGGWVASFASRLLRWKKL